MNGGITDREEPFWSQNWKYQSSKRYCICHLEHSTPTSDDDSNISEYSEHDDEDDSDENDDYEFDCERRFSNIMPHRSTVPVMCSEHLRLAP